MTEPVTHDLATTARLTEFEALAAGLLWLYNTEQPLGAVLQHHGLPLTAGRHRWLAFCPTAYRGLPVVVIQATSARYVTDANDHVLSGDQLEPGELDGLADTITRSGVDVAHVWDGRAGITGSVCLGRPAHPSLLAAVERSRAGCPKHQAAQATCRCAWKQRGQELLIRPEQVRPVLAMKEA